MAKNKSANKKFVKGKGGGKGGGVSKGKCCG